MKLLLVPLLMAITRTMTEPTVQPDIWPRTTGGSALDLRGKMFTLSRNYGGITFYPPNYHSSSTSPTPYPTKRNTQPSWTTEASATPRSWTTTNTYPASTRSWTTSPRSWTTTYPWTTESPTRGVSVCLRHMTDDQSSFPLFTLSPSRSPLRVEGSLNSYTLMFSGYYNYVYLRPLIPFWPTVGRDIWTSVCLTVDTRRGVVQLFSGRNMSVRKVLPSQYVWSSEPVIDFSGFDGQLTDVQMWDYPLRYKEIFYYMNRDYYGCPGPLESSAPERAIKLHIMSEKQAEEAEFLLQRPYSGSVLSWSYIGYTPRGRVVMEESYSMQAKEPIRKVVQYRGPKREKLKFLSMDQRSEDQEKQLF